MDDKKADSLINEILNEMKAKEEKDLAFTKEILSDINDTENKKPAFDGAQYSTTINYLRMDENVILDHIINGGYTISDNVIRLVDPNNYAPTLGITLLPPSKPVSMFYSLPVYAIVDLGFIFKHDELLKIPEIQKEAEIVNEARDWIIETEKPKIINEARDSVIDEFMKSQSYWQRIKNIFW